MRKQIDLGRKVINNSVDFDLPLQGQATGLLLFVTSLVQENLVLHRSQNQGLVLYLDC
jgi:hypothetical protein